MQHFLGQIKNPFSILLLQLMVIFLLSRLIGKLLSKVGQQQVIGEIVAGIALGPSFLGLFFPEIANFIFPKDSLIPLQMISQIGLVFFMFIIGMELDLIKIKNNSRNVLMISQASILFPFVLGMILSYFIYAEFATNNINLLSFSLFMGVAMSITAFPVLARILKEKKISNTPLGNLAIACAAANDAVAWCLLAIVVAIAKSGSIAESGLTIGLTIVYLFVMFYLIKPWFKNLSNKYINQNKYNPGMVALAFFMVLFSSYFTEIIGIHFLFGAFIAGVIMPDNFSFKDHLTNKLEDVSIMILMPVFFAFVGLRTQIGLLNSAHLWSMGALILFVAVAGKFGGTAISARLLGQSWKNSISLGTLMNTRGLMEIIVLNVGYDLGILSPQIFTIMILIALITTFMTGPTLDLIDYLYKRRESRN